MAATGHAVWAAHAVAEVAPTSWPTPSTSKQVARCRASSFSSSRTSREIQRLSFPTRCSDPLPMPQRVRQAGTAWAVTVDSSIDAPSQETATEERQQLFDNIAPVYDQLNDLLSVGQHRVWKRAAILWSRAEEGDTVLDVCCGSGDLSLLLAQRVGPSGKVVGLDFAKEQLMIAEKKQMASFKASKIPMDWVQGDALSLPFPDNTFDAATIGYGLRNVVDIPLCLRQLNRVLKPGSSMAILDFNNSANAFVAGFQGFMLDNLVVPVARNLGVGPEYEYLRPSIERFPKGHDQEQLARSAGFVDVTHYELAGGLMGVLVGTKPL